MKNKKAIYAVTIVISILLVLAIPLTLVLVGFATPSVYADSYYGELPLMYGNMRSVKGKKIVIIGNSNVAFGVDSELIERELAADGLEYKVCNFGLYGAIGTKAMLDLSKNYISEGDIVIFSPEADAQSLSLYFSGLETWRGVDGNWNMLSDLNGAGAIMTGSYPSFVAEKYKFKKSGAPQGAGVYASDSFNARCDMKNADRPYNIMSGGYDENNIIELDGGLLKKEFLTYVNDYYKHVVRAGAEMYFSFAPVNRTGVKDCSPATVEKFYSDIDDGLDFPIISDPNAYILDPEWFYDSNLHLNSVGMTLRSIKLTEDIKNVFGLTSPVKTEIPEKPDIPLPPDGELADDLNAKYFTFEKRDGGYAAVSLTEEGKSLTKITLPAAYMGKRVVTFDRDVFAGNTLVKEITVPQSVRVLKDGAFSGCASLKRLNLLHTSPDEISVGIKLLEGAANCKIYVSRDAYANFVTNYYWGQYADRLYY